jgi:hypothetical protein
VNWKGQQRVLELLAVAAMVAGIIQMYRGHDPQRYWIYGGFALVGVAKLWEAVNVHDPSFKILKIVLCALIPLLCALHLATGAKTLNYILVPLLIYYVLHYRLRFKQTGS